MGSKQEKLVVEQSMTSSGKICEKLTNLSCDGGLNGNSSSLNLFMLRRTLQISLYRITEPTSTWPHSLEPVTSSCPGRISVISSYNLSHRFLNTSPLLWSSGD